MASSPNHIPLFHLMFFLSISLVQIICAREARLFSKFTLQKNLREARSSSNIIAATQVPTVNEPTKLPPQSHHGYGLYSHNRPEFSPTTATTNPNNFVTYNDNSETVRGEYLRSSSSQSGSNIGSELNDERNKINSQEYSSAFQYDNNVHSSRFTNDGQYKSKEYSVDPSKQIGMSDTRFLDNGHGTSNGNGEYYKRDYGYATHYNIAGKEVEDYDPLDP